MIYQAPLNECRRGDSHLRERGFSAGFGNQYDLEGVKLVKVLPRRFVSRLTRTEHQMLFVIFFIENIN